MKRREIVSRHVYSFRELLDLLNLDEVGIAGDMKRNASGDHDVVAGIQMPRLAGNLDGMSNQIVDRVRLWYQNRNHTPCESHEVERLLVWSCCENRLLRTETRHQGCRRARPCRSNNRRCADFLGNVIGRSTDRIPRI